MELPRERKGWLKLLGVVVAIIVAYQLIKRALPDIDAQQVLEDVSDSLGAWTYLIVGVFAFLETGAFVGLVAPGETVVVIAGAIAGQGATSVVLTIGIVWLAAFLGDMCSYFLGAKLGRGWVMEHGPKLRITPERFAQVETYFAKHGGKTILVGRFIGLVRALAPFVAGSSGMAYRQMAPYSVLGTGIWATLFTLLGYYASRNIDAVLSNSEHALLAFAVIVALIVAGVVAYNKLKVPANRARVAAWMEERPVLRNLLALGRRLGPQARFLLNRLTPGGLGLEFTTAVAALAVGSYIAIAYALAVGDSPGPTTGDTTAADFVLNIRTDEEAGGLAGAAWIVENRPEWLAAAGAINESGAVSTTVAGVRFYPIGVAEKGYAAYRIHVQGTWGHGSMPREDNAVVLAAAVITSLAGPEPTRLTPVMTRFLDMAAKALPPGPARVARAIAAGDDALTRRRSTGSATGASAIALRALLRDTISPDVVHAGVKYNVIPGDAVDRGGLPGAARDDRGGHPGATRGAHGTGARGRVHARALVWGEPVEAPAEGDLFEAMTSVVLATTIPRRPPAGHGPVRDRRQAHGRPGHPDLWLLAAPVRGRRAVARPVPRGGRAGERRGPALGPARPLRRRAPLLRLTASGTTRSGP